MAGNNDFQNLGGHKIIEGPSTPNKNSHDQDGTSPEQDSSAENSGSNSSGKMKSRYKGKGVDSKGRPRNFYNPPGKVLRHLAQQSYYDNFYGNQGQFYTLKQKFKTQMCKHFLETGKCPLQQFCQFAHGPTELRQPNDPLPKNFGKTALGAVHSNYKTEPCKNFFSEGECKFGEGCSFYHSEEERRKLIDPLPNLPEGVTLPPMPEKMKQHHNKSRGYYNRNSQFEAAGSPPQPQFTNPQTSMIQITNLADLAAFSGGFGGFNPNKYLSPMPMGYQGQNYFPPHMVYQQQMQQMMQGVQPFGNQNPAGAQGQKQFKPQSSKGQRYEKKEKSTSSPSTGANKSGKKEKSEQKKYVTKQKKEEKTSAVKPLEANAA